MAVTRCHCEESPDKNRGSTWQSLPILMEQILRFLRPCSGQVAQNDNNKEAVILRSPKDDEESVFVPSPLRGGIRWGWFCSALQGVSFHSEISERAG